MLTTTARGRDRLVADLLDWLEQIRTAGHRLLRPLGGRRRVDRSAAAGDADRAGRRAGARRSAPSARRRAPNVEPEVAAIGLVSLIENAASSWLTQDAVFLGLGRRRFVAETADLAERMRRRPSATVRGRRRRRRVELDRQQVVAQVRRRRPRGDTRRRRATPPASRAARRRGSRTAPSPRRARSR